MWAVLPYKCVLDVPLRGLRNARDKIGCITKYDILLFCCACILCSFKEVFVIRTMQWDTKKLHIRTTMYAWSSDSFVTFIGNVAVTVAMRGMHSPVIGHSSAVCITAAMYVCMYSYWWKVIPNYYRIAPPRLLNIVAYMHMLYSVSV